MGLGGEARVLLASGQESSAVVEAITADEEPDAVVPAYDLILDTVELTE